MSPLEGLSEAEATILQNAWLETGVTVKSGLWYNKKETENGTFVLLYSTKNGETMHIPVTGTAAESFMPSVATYSGNSLTVQTVADTPMVFRVSNRVVAGVYTDNVKQPILLGGTFYGGDNARCAVYSSIGTKKELVGFYKNGDTVPFNGEKYTVKVFVWNRTLQPIKE